MFAHGCDAMMRIGSCRTAVVALAVFLLALAALIALRSASSHHYTLSSARAVAVARTDPQVSRAIARHHWNRVSVIPLDRQDQRVTFLRGQQVIAVAAVGPGPEVAHVVIRTTDVDSGSAIANSIPLLVALTLLFLLATASLPLLSLHNLDVLALAAFTPSVAALNYGYILPSVIIAYPPLLYLAVRCIWTGFGRARPPAAESLYSRLTRSWPEPLRRRVLAYVVSGTALVVVVVTVTSTGASDVAFAAVSGATDLLHGVLPYGHIPGFIVHGDTYPLLTYVAYLPAAAIWPVTDFFSDPQGSLFVTAVAVLVTAAAAHRFTLRLVERRPAGVAESARLSGLRMALAWLAFPPVILAASGGANDLVLAACLALALASFRTPGRSAFAIGVGAWIKVIPLFALPLFLARAGRRGALRAGGALVALSAGLCASMIALAGPGAIAAMLHAMSFQLERSSLASLWVGLPFGFLQPVAEATLVACVVAAGLAAARQAALRGDLRRVAALLAGVALLAQICANYWTWAYLPWAFVPLIPALLVATAPERERPAAQLARPAPAVAGNASEAVPIAS